VAVLGSVLIFVLGHSECGAVKAAIDQVEKGDITSGRHPAQSSTRSSPRSSRSRARRRTNLLDAATDENIKMAQAQLETVPILAEGSLRARSPWRVASTSSRAARCSISRREPRRPRSSQPVRARWPRPPVVEAPIRFLVPSSLIRLIPGIVSIVVPGAVDPATETTASSLSLELTHTPGNRGRDTVVPLRGGVAGASIVNASRSSTGS